MNITLTKLYDLLSTKLGKETAENLTNFIENKINHGLESKTNIFATKEDLAKLELKISEWKNEILKWMFIFCVTQVTVTVGYILLYLKYNL
jgi:hypothetical protein